VHLTTFALLELVHFFFVRVEIASGKERRVQAVLPMSHAGVPRERRSEQSIDDEVVMFESGKDKMREPRVLQNLTLLTQGVGA
jgi:hypothetical protein